MNKILDSFDRKSPLKWLVVIGLVVIIGFIIHAHIEKPLIDEIIGDDFVKQGDMKVVPVPIPKKLSFAGEEVPLNLFYVRESLDRELTVNTYWHSQSLLLFKRAHRYFPVIEPILKKNDIPEDFKYMILAESGFLHNISIAGAAGYWQFIKSTAQEYGLEVNQYVDERYNLEKSTEAMCKFLKKAYEKYGTWTLAAAAFNGGMGRFDRIVQSQKTTNYYEMYMNQETSRYSFRILAFKLIFEHPERYGYYFKKENLYPPIPSKEIVVKEDISNLIEFAQKQGINYRILRELNPWISDTSLIVSPNKRYRIKIPTGNYKNYDEMIREEVNKEASVPDNSYDKD